MTSWLILVIAVVYAVISVGYGVDGKPWHALMWAGYALANVALYKMG